MNAPAFVLKTSRLFLRDFRSADSEVLASYQSNPRYLEHYSEAPDAEGIVQTAIAWANEKPRRKFQLAIQLRSSEEPIGTVGLRITEPSSGRADFGCELNPNYWGSGYAEEASRALLDYGVSRLGLRRVEAWTAARNIRAHNLAERLGFRETAPSNRDQLMFVRDYEEEK